MAINYGTAGIRPAAARRRGQRIALAKVLIVRNPTLESRYFATFLVMLGRIYGAPSIISSPPDWQRRS